jgi:eukaryotic-like serine/threonine-protein kinase
MAPEHITGKPVTAQADIYSFGLLFYELLTGVRGVNGDVLEAVMFQILNLPLDPAPMVNAGVSPQVRALVLRCAEKNAADRPESFRSIVEELRGLISGSGADRTQPVAIKTVPLPVTTVPLVIPAPLISAADLPVLKTPALVEAKKSRWGIWVALAGLFVTIAAGALWWPTRNKMPPKPLFIPGMAYIPAGIFLSGPNNTPVSLEAFYIDETEVSNAEFAMYCRVTGCEAPKGFATLPVVGVTVAQAREYAAWSRKRLPTALEWERAARGIQGAKFPWGDTEDVSLANVTGTVLKPAKSYTPYRGAYQMAGNAWEMVEGAVTPSTEAVARFAKLLTPALTPRDKWITMRGGSFNTPLAAAVAYEFVAIPERYSSSDIGFRCAK